MRRALRWSWRWPRPAGDSGGGDLGGGTGSAGAEDGGPIVSTGGGSGRGALPWLLILALLAVQALWLWQAGRWWICGCGRVDLWAGKGAPDGSSQHLFDWYTLSHVIHGILFYAALHWLAPRWPVRWRLVVAVAVEVAWELVENSAWVIERYRQVTVSKDYNGDTVVNSLADVLAMMLGFALARWLPVRASVALVIGLELAAAWAIRDGLLLNVLMLLWPLDWVLQWQAGG